MTSNDPTHGEYPTIQLTRPIRRCLLRNGFIDESGHIIPRRARRSPPRKNVHQNLYIRSLDLERNRRTRTNTSPKRRRIATDDSRIPARPASPVPPQRIRRPLSASVDRTRTTRTNALSQRLPPSKTILLRLATSPQIYSSDQRCLITVQYLGPQSKVEYDQEWIEPDGDEIMVMQQHCGGENLVVFRGCVRKQGLFQFESRRHADFPLGLAFYINNIIVNRLSLCCESRCGANKRIGGPSGAFLIIKMDKAKPCRQCRFKERMRLFDEMTETRRGRNGGNRNDRPSPPRPEPSDGSTSPPPSPPPQPTRPSGSTTTTSSTTRSPPPPPPRPASSLSYSSDFDQPDDTKPKPDTKKKPPNTGGSDKPHRPGSDESDPRAPTTGGSDKPHRPGSGEKDPRATKPGKSSNPNSVNNTDDDEQDDKPLKPIVTHHGTNNNDVVPRPSSATRDDHRTAGAKSPSPIQMNGKVQSLGDTHSPSPQNQPMFSLKNSSSDSTNAQVHSPEWNSTVPQPHRSTPSPPLVQERGRRTSLDRHLTSPPSIRSPSPMTNQNRTDSMPSPIPRARDTPTNEIESPKPSGQNNYDEDFVPSTVEDDLNDDTTEEELKNIPVTTDDDQENPANDTMTSGD